MLNQETITIRKKTKDSLRKCKGSLTWDLFFNIIVLDFNKKDFLKKLDAYEKKLFQ